MNENLLPVTPYKKLTYDELCCLRRCVEQDIAVQQEVLTDVARKLITPQNVVSAISGVVFENMTSGFSLFDIFGRGTRWLRIAIRLLKRIM